MQTHDVLRELLRDGKNFYFSDRALVKALNDSEHLSEDDKRAIAGPSGKLEINRNYPKPGDTPVETARRLEALKDGLVKVIEDKAREEAKPGDALKAAKAVLDSTQFEGPGRGLKSEEIERRLCRGFRPEDRGDADAQALVASPVFGGHPAKTADDGRDFASAKGGDQLDAISRHNLQGMRQEAMALRREFAADPWLKERLGDVDRARDAVAERYRGGIVAHASNRHIEGQLLCTNDRGEIQDLAKELSGSKAKMDKFSHTAPTNTAHLDSHDFVFFNVYPGAGTETRNAMLNGTRYFKTTPEDARSAVAADAQSFVFGLNKFGGSGQVCALALRDPVYPCGGTTGEDAHKRLGVGGLATVGSQEACQFNRKFGTVDDNYKTSERIFSSKNMHEALTLNVELGMLRTFKGLYEQQKTEPAPLDHTSTPLYRFQTMVGAAAPAASGADADKTDKAMVSLIKMYQYPQLLVSGPVQLQEAEVHQPKGATQWQDQQAQQAQAAQQQEQQQQAQRAYGR